MSYPRLKTVRVVDFQAIQDTEITLGNLTVLTGEGDVGKSSFIRAIRSAFLNNGNDLDIRHDTKGCAVVLTFEDGTIIEWSKVLGKGGAYQMTTPEGEVTSYTKCGGQVPEAVAKFLGIGVVTLDDTTDLTPQVSDQHDQPFILWLSGSRRARAIGKATRLDVVVTAQMACKKRLDAFGRELAASAKDAQATNLTIAALPPFEGVGKRVAITQETLKMIDVNLALANQYEQLHGRIQTAENRQQALDLTEVKELLEGASTSLDRMERLSDLYQRFNKLELGDVELAASLIEARSTHETDNDLYRELCSKQGICPDCQGLYDHKRCQV